MEVKAGVGVGLGGEISANVEKISISASAKNTVSNAIVIDDKKFDVKNITEISSSFSIYNFELGHSSGRQHSFFDKNCDCDFFGDPIAKGTKCQANTEYNDKSLSLGISLAIYVGIGAELSCGINLKEFFDEIIDIYNTEYEGYY